MSVPYKNIHEAIKLYKDCQEEYYKIFSKYTGISVMTLKKKTYDQLRELAMRYPMNRGGNTLLRNVESITNLECAMLALNDLFYSSLN